jgi:hypothetical protein
MEDRGDNKIILQKDKMMFKKLEETGKFNVTEFAGEVVAFYATYICYIEMWEGSIKEAESFSWINLNNVK